MILAQRFIAGSRKTPVAFRPVGTIELKGKDKMNPLGRTSFVPSGRFSAEASLPSNKLLGYFPMSLRDEGNEIRPPWRRISKAAVARGGGRGKVRIQVCFPSSGKRNTSFYKPVIIYRRSKNKLVRSGFPSRELDNFPTRFFIKCRQAAGPLPGQAIT
jgi:hypothetical protein